MVDERERDEKSNMQMVENEMRDNYWFNLPVRASHFRFVSNIVSIPEDLGRQCDWRTCHSRRGILDVSRKFRRKILSCSRLLIVCHCIPRPSVSRLRATCHVLWQNLHASYPSQARELVDSNLAAACGVLGVVDELLMNPINFHVDDPSRLINGHSD
jgi:hypothetical protein